MVGNPARAGKERKMICKHLTIESEGEEAYWWCREFRKFVDHRDCTILPCKPEISLAGCKQAELSDTEKIQLEEAKKSNLPLFPIDI